MANKPAAKAKKAKATPPKKEKAAKQSRKATTQGSANLGHNITAIRKAAEPHFKKLFALQEQMDSDMGGYQSDFNDLYEKAATDVGCKVTVIKGEYRRMLANKRRMEKEADMEKAERDQIEAIRAAMKGTQFELFSEGELAPMSKDAEKRAAAEAKEAEKAKTDQKKDGEKKDGDDKKDDGEKTDNVVKLHDA